MTIIVDTDKHGITLTLLLFDPDGLLWEKELYYDATYTPQMAVDFAIAEYAPLPYLTGEQLPKVIYN